MVTKPVENSPFEEGSLDARICIVGEAPASNEMRLWRPFVGAAGRLLDDCLHEAELSRRQCYLTNVFERPIVKNEATGIWKDSKSGEELYNAKKGNFTPYGQQSVGRMLDRIRKSRASVLVSLGGCALSALYGKSAITKYRGSVLAADSGTGEGVQGRKLVPSIHPAAILRGMFLWKYLLISDLRRVREEMAYRDLRLPNRNLIIDPSFSDSIEYLEEANRKGQINTDIEVYNRQVSCFSIAWSPEEAMSIPLVYEQGLHRWSEEEEAEIWAAYSRLIGNSKVAKVNQNLLFDLWVLFMQNQIVPDGRFDDPMCAFSCIYPDFSGKGEGKSLAFISSIMTREPYYKDEGKIWKKPWVDLDRFWRYNARDSAISLECWLRCSEELDALGFRETYEMTVEMFPSLLYMMVTGVPVDPKSLAVMRDEIKTKIEAKEAELEQRSDYTFNPGSPKQCYEYFYVHKRIKPYISRKTGNPTTDDTAMSRIIKRYGLPEARLVQEIRALKKLEGTYLEMKYDPDNRLRCMYNPRGTVTGRLSSSQTIFETGGNMQNLDPQFKSFLVANEVR